MSKYNLLNSIQKLSKNPSEFVSSNDINKLMPETSRLDLLYYAHDLRNEGLILMHGGGTYFEAKLTTWGRNYLLNL